RLNISLGKTNYLIHELILRGSIKVKNFTNNPGKLKKIHYLLTEKGIEERFRLLQHFLQKKEAEYNNLKQESDLLMGCCEMRQSRHSGESRNPEMETYETTTVVNTEKASILSS
ncbi:MAG: hypothetical protein C0412_10280, partial [Flavobacterium sp.]|nr:hypothetical protein [Flavobacterium sp.]